MERTHDTAREMARPPGDLLNVVFSSRCFPKDKDIISCYVPGIIEKKIREVGSRGGPPLAHVVHVLHPMVHELTRV